MFIRWNIYQPVAALLPTYTNHNCTMPSIPTIAILTDWTSMSLAFPGKSEPPSCVPLGSFGFVCWPLPNEPVRSATAKSIQTLDRHSTEFPLLLLKTSTAVLPSSSLSAGLDSAPPPKRTLLAFTVTVKAMARTPTVIQMALALTANALTITVRHSQPA